MVEFNKWTPRSFSRDSSRKARYTPEPRTFCTVSTRGNRTEAGRGENARPDRRVPWDSALCASQFAECPGRDALPFAIARTRTLAFYGAVPLSSGTPYKVTNDCHSDSRRRVLNKDRTRLNYMILPAFTCRTIHYTWKNASTIHGVPLLWATQNRLWDTRRKFSFHYDAPFASKYTYTVKLKNDRIRIPLTQ